MIAGESEWGGERYVELTSTSPVIAPSPPVLKSGLGWMPPGCRK
jgi:hypothetical protein